MRKLIFLVFMVGISFIYLISCDGGDGNGEEDFTVFDVLIDIEAVGGHVFECPDSTNIKLSLLINEDKISGFAELIAEGEIGDAEAIKGLVESGEFSLEPFVIEVIFGGGIFGPHVTKYDFQDFKAMFIDESADGIVNGLEGNASGQVFVIDGDAIYCDAEFTGNFSGISRSPEGCVSPQEAPTLECPAEGFVNQCDVYSHYFCFGYCVPSDEGDICSDLSFNASDCEVVDCLNVRCPGTGIVNLEGLEDYGSFQYVTPVGTMETCS